MSYREEHCPCCHNHCSRNNLHCSQGRKYFEKLDKESESVEKSTSVVYSLMEAGHALHRMKKQGNRFKEAEILKNLESDEIEELKRLLSKLEIDKKHHHRRQ